MAEEIELPRCEYRVPFPEPGRYYCRHSQVRAADHLVNGLICVTCQWHSVPCYWPRPLQWKASSRAVTPALPSPLVFLTTEQLVADTRALVGRLPPSLSAVAGIPRSGLLPASILAALLHLPLYSLCRERGLIPVGHGKRLASTPRRDGPLLVIDDSVNGGYAMYQAQQALARFAPDAEALYAALYPRPESAGCVEFFARLMPLPHLFEWNLCNCLQAQGIAFDFDGVLCEDFVGNEEDEEQYLTFLRSARPRWLPRRHPVPLVVTARLEKYRDLTEEWLKRHDIKVRKLVMGPWENRHERRGAYRAGRYKGEPYAASTCSLFVESDERQAMEIFEATRRPVLCATTGRIFQ